MSQQFSHICKSRVANLWNSQFGLCGDMDWFRNYIRYCFKEFSYKRRISIFQPYNWSSCSWFREYLCWCANDLLLLLFRIFNCDSWPKFLGFDISSVWRLRVRWYLFVSWEVLGNVNLWRSFNMFHRWFLKGDFLFRGNIFNVQNGMLLIKWLWNIFPLNDRFYFSIMRFDHSYSLGMFGNWWLFLTFRNSASMLYVTLRNDLLNSHISPHKTSTTLSTSNTFPPDSGLGAFRPLQSLGIGLWNEYNVPFWTDIFEIGIWNFHSKLLFRLF